MRDVAKHQEYHADFAVFKLAPFDPATYMTKGFYTWWTEFYSNNMFDSTEIKDQLTQAFSSLQDHGPKGKTTHCKEIKAFQDYFEIVYDPTQLSRTVYQASLILKEKFTKTLSKLKLPKSAKPEFKYDLAFELQPPRFPKLPTTDFALEFSPPYPDWFVCGNIFHDLHNDSQKRAKRVVPTKLTLDSFDGFIHYDLSAVRILSPTLQGSKLKNVF